MTVSIRGAHIIDPASGLGQVGDLHIGAGKIVAIGAASVDFSARRTLDDAGLVTAPGLIDLSVTLREPDYERKGNVENETRAAVAGGTASLCCPFYTRPVLDTPAMAELILDHAHEVGNAKIYPVGALTRGFGGKRLSELVALRNAGCVAFTNGLYSFASNHALRHALEYAATFDLTVIFTSQDTDFAEGGLAHEGPTTSFLGLAGIPETAETMASAHSLLLVEQSGVHAHFSQLTSARGIELVAQTQTRGLPVTCDVTLYQLVLTDEALVDFSNLYHVQPPLRAGADREALREAVKNGMVRATVSHHQPHEIDAKNAPFATTEPGISSAELLLPLTMTLVQDGLLNLPTLLACLPRGPAQALHLPTGRLVVGQAAGLVLFGPQGSTLASESWYSEGQNSPFVGHCLPGRVRYALVDGHLIHEG